MNRYNVISEVGRGAFAVVSRASQVNTGEIVAVKHMKQRFHTWEECLQLREILSLRRLQHPNLIKLKEVVRENNELFLIFEFMEGSVFNLQKQRTEQVGQASGGVFSEKEIRSIIAQVLLGLQIVHRGGFMHRDLKPENLLTKGDMVKIADFGLAKEIRSRPPFTEYVSTRWYRAPEIVLRSAHYNSPIDIWACGVIFAELYLNRALLPGSSDSDQLFKICSVLGSPSLQDWDEGHQLARRLNVRFPSVCAPPLRTQIPNASSDAINLIESMLRFNPSERPTASQCLQHPFFCQSIGPEISVHYQGVSTGAAHNPFQVAISGSTLPGATSSNTTPVNQPRLHSSGSAGSSSSSSLPPPPNVVGAAARRPSPLGNPIPSHLNTSSTSSNPSSSSTTTGGTGILGRRSNSPLGNYGGGGGGHHQFGTLGQSGQSGGIGSNPTTQFNQPVSHQRTSSLGEGSNVSSSSNQQHDSIHRRQFEPSGGISNTRTSSGHNTPIHGATSYAPLGTTSTGGSSTGSGGIHQQQRLSGSTTTGGITSMPPPMFGSSGSSTNTNPSSSTSSTTPNPLGNVVAGRRAPSPVSGLNRGFGSGGAGMFGGGQPFSGLGGGGSGSTGNSGGTGSSSIPRGIIGGGSSSTVASTGAYAGGGRQQLSSIGDDQY